MKHIDVENILNSVFDLERVESSKGLGKMIRDVEEKYGLDPEYYEDNPMKDTLRSNIRSPKQGEIIELFGSDLENIRAAQKNPEMDDEM